MMQHLQANVVLLPGECAGTFGGRGQPADGRLGRLFLQSSCPAVKQPSSRALRHPLLTMPFASCISVLGPLPGSECLALDTAHGGHLGSTSQWTVVFVMTSEEELKGRGLFALYVFALSCASEQGWQVEVSRRLISVGERASRRALGLLDRRSLGRTPAWELGLLV